MSATKVGTVDTELTKNSNILTVILKQIRSPSLSRIFLTRHLQRRRLCDDGKGRWEVLKKRPNCFGLRV